MTPQFINAARIPIEVRFWKYVDKKGPNECWLWNSKSVTSAGYGLIWESQIKGHKKKKWDVHRLSWTLHNGQIPLDMQVLHKCDIKRCVNPNHLYLGTRKDNMRDALERGQKPIGSQCSFVKLTPLQVRLIRRLKATGLTQQELSNLFKVSKGTIFRAYSGKAYNDVTLL